MFTTQWKRLVRRPRHRWKILTSSYIRCDVPDGIDLAQGACKPRLNVHAVCNVGSFCTCWATACCTRRQCCGLDDQGIIHQFQTGEKFSLIIIVSRQLVRPAQPPIQPRLMVKQLGQEANHLSLSSASVKKVWSCMCCTSTPLYTLTVWCLMKHGDSFTLYEMFSC